MRFLDEEPDVHEVEHNWFLKESVFAEESCNRCGVVHPSKDCPTVTLDLLYKRER